MWASRHGPCIQQRPVYLFMPYVGMAGVLSQTTLCHLFWQIQGEEVSSLFYRGPWSSTHMVILSTYRVGFVLYTTYLHTLGNLHGPASQSTRRIYPPVHPSDTFTAGFLAGTVQSVVAAPLDALQVRLRIDDMLEGRYQNMWQYGRHKLKQIGPGGIFAGWSLSFLRDSLGSALFFSCFEYIKSQAYYSFVSAWYEPRHGGHAEKLRLTESNDDDDDDDFPLIEPHYAVEPFFLMTAGIMASIGQQAIQHPLNTIQNIHFERLEHLDHQVSLGASRRRVFKIYYHAYRETFERCKKKSQHAGGWGKWLFNGFTGTAIRRVPSTSAGLIIFELMRRKYADFSDSVYIRKDGYGIIL